jgi:insecticidal toxin complex protein TccC
MDVSGLYYYGARYYAAWLQHWVSADPAGDVDGLNLYGFVGNNPMNFIDHDGEKRTPDELGTVILGYSSMLQANEILLTNTIDQFYNNSRTRDIYKLSAKRAIARSANAFVAAVAATITATFTAVVTAPILGPAAPLAGIVAGTLAADAAGNRIEQSMRNAGFGIPIVPSHGDYEIENLEKKANPEKPMTKLKKLISKYDPRSADGLKELAIASGITLVDKLLDFVHLDKINTLYDLSVEMSEALNGSLKSADIELIKRGVQSMADFMETQKEIASQALDELESLGGTYAKQAIATRQLIAPKEIVVAGKTRRAVEMIPRVKAYLEKRSVLPAGAST